MSKNSVIPIQRNDGQICHGTEETLECWRAHYQNVLNHPPASHCLDLDTATLTAASNTNISEDAPTRQEIRKAIGKLKNGRAAGPDNMQPELLKYTEEPTTNALHTLFGEVWKSDKVPAELREGIIKSLYKGEGSQTFCSNYRPISLLSVPGKVFAHVLLFQPLLTMCRRLQQSGFTAGRSTTDAILALRLLPKLHHEFNQR